jgi:hypothetical protein
MFPIPAYPFVIPWLQPYHDYAPLIWFSGLVCLWLTRYTHQLARRWGARYYWASAAVRPLGVLLVALGWAAVFAGERRGFVVTPDSLKGWQRLLGLWEGRPTVLF